MRKIESLGTAARDTQYRVLMPFLCAACAAQRRCNRVAACEVRASIHPGSVSLHVAWGDRGDLGSVSPL